MAKRDLARGGDLACALAIGGLDPGGGAGLAADLRAFAAAGAFGCAAAAVLTVQSTSGLRAAHAVAPERVIAQAREVVKHQRVGAIKIGALGSAANVRAVGDWIAGRRVPVVVDTPMMPSRGGVRLLAERGVAAIRASLVPRATLVTANVREAELLAKRRVTSVAQARDAARALVDLGAQAALVKGGHLTGENAIDVLVIDGETIELGARRLAIGGVHGTGCTLASLIAGRLAVRGDGDVRSAVRWAKTMHHAALKRAANVGGDLRVIPLR